MIRFLYPQVLWLLALLPLLACSSTRARVIAPFGHTRAKPAASARRKISATIVAVSIE